MQVRLLGFDKWVMMLAVQDERIRRARELRLGSFSFVAIQGLGHSSALVGNRVTTTRVTLCVDAIDPMSIDIYSSWCLNEVPVKGLV